MWRNTVDLTVVLMSSRGCLTQEKIVASCAKQFVIIADDRYMNGIFLIMQMYVFFFRSRFSILHKHNKEFGRI